MLVVVVGDLSFVVVVGLVVVVCDVIACAADAVDVKP